MKLENMMRVVAVVALAVGCTDGPKPVTDDVARSSEAIWRGTADDGPTIDPYRNAIVQIRAPSGGACTGFYVTSQLIVTAAHCVVGSNVGGGVAGGIKEGATGLKWFAPTQRLTETGSTDPHRAEPGENQRSRKIRAQGEARASRAPLTLLNPPPHRLPIESTAIAPSAGRAMAVRRKD